MPDIQSCKAYVKFVELPSACSPYRPGNPFMSTELPGQLAVTARRTAGRRECQRLARAWHIWVGLAHAETRKPGGGKGNALGPRQTVLAATSTTLTQVVINSPNLFLSAPPRLRVSRETCPNSPSDGAFSRDNGDSEPCFLRSDLVHHSDKLTRRRENPEGKKECTGSPSNCTRGHIDDVDAGCHQLPQSVSLRASAAPRETKNLYLLAPEFESPTARIILITTRQPNFV